MDRITDNIYIGNSHEAQNLNFLKTNGITAILNVAFELKNHFSLLDNGIQTTHVGLIDGEENNIPAIYAAVLQLGSLMKQGNRVLVHCAMGASRSPFVVMCYLRAIGFKPEDAKIKIEPDIPLDLKGQTLFRFIMQQRSAAMINGNLLKRYDELDYDFLHRIIIESKGYKLPD